MSDRLAERTEAWLGRWSAAVRRHATLLLWLAPVLAGASALYAVRSLRVNTDTSSLVSEDLGFRRQFRAYQAAFSDDSDDLLVLVEGATPGLASRAVRRLAARLRQDTAVVEAVYVPGEDPFFDRHWALYLAPDSLADLIGRVERSGVLLRTVARDPGPGGLVDALVAEMARGGGASPGGGAAPGDGGDLRPVLGLLARSVFAATEGRFEPVPWSALLQGREPEPADRRRVLLVTPRLAFENTVPGEAAMAAVRRSARDLGLLPRNGVNVRLTGSVAIEAEELQTAVAGVRQSGFLALTSVGIILFFALRSRRLILGSLLTLTTGLFATAAFAAFAVGHLNLISVAFAVLYIGLGIDYAIHLSLRYRSLRLGGYENDVAVDGAVRQVGSALALSALTTAACFYAFVPTDFTGVSELGIIGGTGMFVSLAATLTFLPAFLARRPLRAGAPARARGGSGGLERLGVWIRRHRRWILGGGALGTVAALAAVPHARFDHNSLNLRDPGSESVVAFRTLLADPASNPLTISVLRDDLRDRSEVEARLAGLEVVEGVRTIADFVPEAQDRKLPLLARLRRVFDGIDGVAAPGRAHPCGPELEGSGAAGEGRPAADDADRAAVRRLLCALEDYRWSAPPEEREVARQLYHLLGRWQRRVDAWPPAERRVHYRALGAALVGALPDQIERLRAAATAGPVTIDDLPADLRRRWIALDGRLRIEILPAEALLTTESIRRFVDGVRARIPDATGSAVSELETGRVAVRAFRSALAWAGLATVILLLALLRDLRAVALVTGPLLLAAVWTAAATVWLDLPFNFANVIALPLLLGVGVDNGVHMVHQARFGPAGSRDPMASSTSRAVLFATLTTIASFGNLAFATHVGMASMGRLLTVGMLCVLLATLILLPALMGDAEVGGVGGR